MTEDFSILGTGHAGFSRRYNRFLYLRRKNVFLAALTRHGITIGGKSILDVGCGTGYFLECYRKLGAARLAGIDITDVSVEKLKRRFSEGKFTVMDISRPESVLAERFDVVHVFDVLYHIIDDESFATALRNISAMIASGGRLIFTDYFARLDQTVSHVRYRPREMYETVFSQERITIKEVVPLFHLLGKSPVGLFKNRFAQGCAARFIEAAVPVIYALDSLYCPAHKAHLRMIVCQKE